MPVEGGDEVHVLDSARFGFWTVVQQGICFLDFNAASDATKPVKFYSFQTRQTTQIGTTEWNGRRRALPSAPTAAGFCIALSKVRKPI
jgi:hypothetical protein